MNDLSDREFRKLQFLLDIYSKLESFPPKVKNPEKYAQVLEKQQARAK